MEQLVNGAWLEKELGAPDLRVLDCTVVMEVDQDGRRSYRPGGVDWAQGHIPGSVHVDLFELSDASSPYPFMLPSAEQFSTAMSDLGVSNGTRVVLYDAAINAWASRVWWMLRAFGFDNAGILDGGWRSWTLDGRPTSTDPAPRHPPGVLSARLRSGLFVGKVEVLSAIDRSEVCIVDALPEAMYRGERQDYARPGHIPGASNVPFGALVDLDTHRYLPTDQLRAAFSSVLATAPGRVITYCGGAIAASSDAFVLNLLGVENVAIYDGSLSEWAADPTLPLVTGSYGAQTGV
jgi:thiosulfate/3-mercaptopyruvate sulfurtransferase